MSINVRRVFVEKKAGFDIEAQNLYADIKENLGLKNLEGIRVINRYDVAGLTEAEYAKARNIVFSEPTVDKVYDEELPVDAGQVFAFEYLPGQYDQRADSAAQCVQIITGKERPGILTAKVLVLKGTITAEELAKIKAYCINSVEAREASLSKPDKLDITSEIPEDVAIIDGFAAASKDELEKLMADMGLAMALEDLQFCQEYFKNVEQRNPTVTEIKVIDTYWSDHCRHTTFNTVIDKVEMEANELTKPITRAYDKYVAARQLVYGDKPKDMSLMDIAVLGMKELRKQGKLKDLDESDEINACSIKVTVDVDGQPQPWLLMFKNETHNHPTEIEPFGGAATCLGGAIRDPLSGRAYVYQAMRVTGSGDPTQAVSETLSGKLPQRKITIGAAAGYSSYGNQIGLATGQVAEFYHPGFVAKRMEIGAVIGAAPAENVRREVPSAGDVVLLLGGKTGRDGCGGATGSSKEHTTESLATCGAEVQKGNAPTERKLQRLFRNPKASRLIKRCNDFGAGGVSVAIGELTDGIDINLDCVPKKYEGLDGTELAISESQERMAVVVAAQDVPVFTELAREENLEATLVAKVTDKARLCLQWRGKTIVDLSREFLDTNGVKGHTTVKVTAPDASDDFFKPKAIKFDNIKKAWLAMLQDLNVCSQQGLVERFDATIGAATVLMPFGGKYQQTPSEGMAAKLPVLNGETTTASIMTFGYNPHLASWSPFHGALYAVVEAVSKIVALGGDYTKTRLTLQEYFEKLGKDETKWGKPFSALLGAYYAQAELGIPAIGGKDSMSGTFMDMNVPPTLTAFAVTTADAAKVISQEFKQPHSKVVLIRVERDDCQVPDFSKLTKSYAKITELINQDKVLASYTVKAGGIAAAISKMCFGNRIGMAFSSSAIDKLLAPDYGSIILEMPQDIDLAAEFGAVAYEQLGTTQSQPVICIGDIKITLEEAFAAWSSRLEKIFPTKAHGPQGHPMDILSNLPNTKTSYKGVSFAKPRVVIPVFPGTNCEYDSAKAFERNGGCVETLVIRNLTPEDIEQSIAALCAKISQSQIVMLPGGFSAGDEPDGSGKFIAAMFRNAKLKNAVHELLYQRDGLMLGICNGFQALIKLGLVPYGEIRDLDAACPTLTFNSIDRHISCMSRTKVSSKLSPWFNNVQVGDIHTIALSHGEGRFVASEEMIKKLIDNGQVATQYVDANGKPSYDIEYNPNGSIQAIEGITSPDGRVLGKMGHSERVGSYLYKNIPGEKEQGIFQAGISYFK